jgi:hypothetical protein
MSAEPCPPVNLLDISNPFFSRSIIMKTTHLAAFAALAVLSAAAWPTSAFAALGGTADTVQSDRMKMKVAARSMKSAANYTVQELQLASGTTVREYMGAGGIVFGVAWKGPVKPDLRQILGQYFSTLSDPSAVKYSNHTQMHLQKDDLVIHSSGHMRAFAGQAYLSSALPQGVAASDIQ